MNEACSAGTGSFQEAAKESLGIDYREIQDYALESQSPPVSVISVQLLSYRT